MSDSRKYGVLFLCTGNSARSILAEVLLNAMGSGQFSAFSAGSHPKGAVHPLALDLLRKKGMNTEGLRSKSWDEFAGADAPTLHFVFTVCDNAAGETCPVWFGEPITAHWSIPDPAAVGGGDAEQREAFLEAYQQLANRLSVLVNLPLADLDRKSVQRALNRIGDTALAKPQT